MCGSLLLLLSLFAQTVGAQSPNGYYRGDNGGHYYVRTVGNTVYWYAEHASGDWAHVFRGTLNARRTEFEGQFYDIPSGRAYNTGRRRFEYNRTSDIITSLTPGSSFRTARRQDLPRYDYLFDPNGLPNTACVGREVQIMSNITGCWDGNDGGLYYMSQGTHPEGELVVWYGQNIDRSTGRPSFSNIAIGTRRGNNINLTWVDVPKGIARGQGTLNLRVQSSTSGLTITRISGTGFGGSRWTPRLI